MKQELELELVKKYPGILKDYRGDKMETCMAWGMECGDGWYDILDDLMHKVQYLCGLFSTEGKKVEVVAAQIKEKFGTLCFYFDQRGGDDIQASIIRCVVSSAERASGHVCELCGKRGSLCTSGFWYTTLCYDCAREKGFKACDKGTEEYWVELDEKKKLEA